MWRSIVRRLGVVLAGLLAATLVMELVLQLILATPLRWVLPVPEIPLYGPDEFTGYRHRPHVSGLWTTEHRTFITTSNLGLRDRDRDPAHGKGPRVIVLGDSFIEAAQVDLPQTAVAIAERILAQKIPDAEVVNLGLANVRPAQLVARLESQGLALAPDVAVVVLSLQRLQSPETDDREFTAYQAGPDGELHLSYGFRASAGYRFRTSRAGHIFYWLLDHSQVMRVLNDRKNVGLADARPAYWRGNGDHTVWQCDAGIFDAQAELWLEGRPPLARAVTDAFIRDLAMIARTKQLPIIVAVRGIEARCPDLSAERAALIDAVRNKLETAGLHFVDLDAQVMARVGQNGVGPLYGFGPGLGDGHWNVEGNRIHGEILAGVIAAALPQQ
jgi:hypothetical protein